MKSLKEYVTEQSNEFTLRNLRVIYKGPSEFSIEVPVSYDESDIQIYIEDTLMRFMPGGNDDHKADRLFGKNVKNIVDSHIEFESVSYKTNSEADMPWDTSYDARLNDREKKTAILKNISFILEFSEFAMRGVTDETIDSKLYEIMSQYADNDIKDALLTLSLNAADITYDGK